MKIVVLGGTGFDRRETRKLAPFAWPRSHSGISFARHQLDYGKRFDRGTNRSAGGRGSGGGVLRCR